MRLRWSWVAACALLCASVAAFSQSTVPVLMLSDLHFDPLHDPAKAERLAAAPVAQWDAILREPDSAGQAESFAAMQLACHAKGVDTDEALLDASLKAAHEQAKSARFVTVTGDLLVHGFDCRYGRAVKDKSNYAAFAEKTAVYVMRRVEAAFFGVPVYFALGNNDSSCGDYQLDAHDRFLSATEDAVVDGFHGMSPAELKRARQDYASGGYYGVTLGSLPKTRLLAIDDIFLSDKYVSCSGKKDNRGAEAMLTWLDRELTSAKLHGEKVWVVGHIPPSVDAFSTLKKLGNVCDGAQVKLFMESDELAKTLEKHADVVELGVFGHTHSDEVRLLRGNNGSVPIKLVASISPVHGNRPTFTVAQVDAATAILGDYTVFEASNATGKETTWAKEYSFRGVYREPDFSGSSVSDLVGQLHADRGGEKPASHAYETYFAPAMLPVLSLVWAEYGCALDQTTADGFRACACGTKK